jgi:hypothetical protein
VVTVEKITSSEKRPILTNERASRLLELGYPNLTKFLISACGYEKPFLHWEILPGPPEGPDGKKCTRTSQTTKKLLSQSYFGGADEAIVLLDIIIEEARRCSPPRLDVVVSNPVSSSS